MRVQKRKKRKRGDRLEEVILYSMGCPACGVLKKKLDEKRVRYTENNSVKEMTALGIKQVPVLKVGDHMMTLKEAVDWVSRQ